MTNPRTIEHYQTDTQEVARSLHAGLAALTGTPNVATAWRKFISPTDIIGLKISTVAGPSRPTHPALVDAAVESLKRAGVPASNIIVWDKMADTMRRAGFPVSEKNLSGESASTPQYLATFPDEGYDDDVFYETQLPGRPIWGDHELGKSQLATRSYYSRIVTRRITKLICLPVMTDSRESGLAGGLFTMASGSVDNTRRFLGEPVFFDPIAAEICDHEVIRPKWGLTIADGLIAQYFGGPSFHPQYCWHHGTLYLSDDPVAVDAVMLEEIETRRKQAGIPPIGEKASHIQTAAAYDLGVADLAQIEKVALQI